MAAASSMEDEIQKRNTDCVYFLASPLTCKKGSECEYRHSESARLNPRDCWYWLSGNCINPTCAFRHPPLEGLAGTTSDSTYLPLHSTVPTSRTNVPCYFYFNAFCIKGDQCPFLHGQDDILSARKFPKTSCEVTSAQRQENKKSTGSDMGPASVEAPANPSEGISKEIINQFYPKDDVQNTAPTNILDEPSPSPELSMPKCEEAAFKVSDNPLPTGDYINSGANLCSDQSSDELVKDCSEPEEWWESSPGFDVLVDDGSEQLAYKDDADYLLVQERESERLHNHLLQYNYEGSAGYDPTDYADRGFLYDHGLYEPHDNLDDGYTHDHVEQIPEHSRERALEPMFHRERRVLSRDWNVERRDGMNLRDHLRKRRRVDVHQISHSSRKRQSKGSSQERLMRHRMGHSHQSRLPSEVGRNMFGSLSSEALNENCRRGLSAYPQSRRRTRSRQREIESRRRGRQERLSLVHSSEILQQEIESRRRGRQERLPLVHSSEILQREIESRRGRQERLPLVHSSEISKGLASKEAKLGQASTTGFTGPKTLAQIKEEKRRAKADGNGFANHIPQPQNKYTSNDFQGPKPLSELLKDKKQPVSVNDSMNGSAFKFEHTELAGVHPETSVENGHLNEDTGMPCHGTSENLYREYEGEFLDDDYDDDDDILAKKLADILS